MVAYHSLIDFKNENTLPMADILYKRRSLERNHRLLDNERWKELAVFFKHFLATGFFFFFPKCSQSYDQSQLINKHEKKPSAYISLLLRLGERNWWVQSHLACDCWVGTRTHVSQFLGQGSLNQARHGMFFFWGLLFFQSSDEKRMKKKD